MLVALGVSIATGALLRSTSTLHRPPFQPSGAAFGIWGVIYTAIAICGVSIMNQKVSWWPVVLLASSLLCSAGWLATVGLAEKRWSALLISLAALTAAGSVSLLKPSLRSPSDWATSAGPSLLAGWLGVAVGLGINLAYHEVTKDDLPAWILIPGGVIASASGIIGGAPLTGLPLLWAALFSKRSSVSLLVGGLGILTAGVATFRGLDR